MAAAEPDPAVVEAFRKIVVEGDHGVRLIRRAFKALPSSPRCKVCNSPFHGLGGQIVKPFGFTPYRKNPSICKVCCEKLPVGGVEADIAVLFADVRGSTAMGERAEAAEFAGLMNRFYETATRVLLKHDALIDKLIGDEVMALFIPGVAGKDYVSHAARAGIELLQAVGYSPGSQPWLPLAVAVHRGTAYVGNVGSGDVVDFTALGDTVNAAARLQSEGAAGQLILSDAVATDCPNLVASAEPRTVHLRGKEEPLGIHVLTAATLPT